MSRQNRELIALEAGVRRFGLWRWRCLVVKVAIRLSPLVWRCCSRCLAPR